jgi:hypothetical protein
LDRLLAELDPAVERLGAAPLTPDRLRVLLDRSEVRAWLIDGPEPGARAHQNLNAPGLLAGRCPRGSGPALLATRRSLPEGLGRGSYLVSRSLPVGPGRWVLIGRIAHVAPARTAGFEQVLASLRAPHGEFWRVHGSVVAQAARAA